MAYTMHHRIYKTFGEQSQTTAARRMWERDEAIGKNAGTQIDMNESNRGKSSSDCKRCAILLNDYLKSVRCLYVCCSVCCVCRMCVYFMNYVRIYCTSTWFLFIPMSRLSMQSVTRTAGVHAYLSHERGENKGQCLYTQNV